MKKQNVLGAVSGRAVVQGKGASVTIHRGANQIGGSITEIATDSTRILIDCGAELPGSCGAVRDDDIVKMLRERHFDAVLFTHYHGDHTGLMDRIPADVPLYMDEAMQKILTTLCKYARNDEMEELLTNPDGRIHSFIPPKSFTIGDMTVTPFFVDHSAYHANMFLIEAGGQTILVSGDFRSTGYMGKSLDQIPKIIEKYHKPVDALLCEGTMMTRSAEGKRSMTEWDLAKEAEAFLKTHRQAYVLCSSTNFDTVSSIYRAARKNGLKVYANGYICAMLRTFSDIAAKHAGLYNLKGIKHSRQLTDEAKDGFVLLLGTCLGMSPRGLDYYYDFLTDGVEEPWLIYSMWKGYLNPKHSAYNSHLAGFVSQFGERVKYAHTPGHADKETLARFIEAVKPQKYILPFHTENAEGFRELDVEDKYKSMVRIMRDGETIEIK